MAASKKALKTKAEVKPPYEKTEADRQLIKRFCRKRDAAPKGSVRLDGNDLSFDHEDQVIGQLELMESLGITETAFFAPMLNELANIADFGFSNTQDAMNFILSVVKSIEPRDHVEIMLGMQMAAVHMHSMRFSRRLSRPCDLSEMEAMDRALNKLMRTFTAQMEALRKYRTGGEQKVTVQHVHVNEGGQAVVGNVSHPGGGSVKPKDQPHAVGHAESTEMPREIEAQREKVPVTRSKG